VSPWYATLASFLPRALLMDERSFILDRGKAKRKTRHAPATSPA